MKKIIFILCLFPFITGANLSVLTVNDQTGHLSSSATVNQSPPEEPEALPGSFWETDGNTVIHFKGFSSNTASTGTGSSDTNWSLSGTDSTQTEQVTMGTQTVELVTRNFDGSSTFMTAPGPIISSSFGDHTVECVILVDTLDSATNRFFGNLNAAATEGHQVLTVTGTYYINDFTGGSSRTNFNDAGSITGNDGVWIHFVMTYDAGATTRKIAYRVGDLITDMTTSGVGNDYMGSDASGGDSYGTTANYFFGQSQSGASGLLDGKAAEFRISDNVRY